MAVVAELEAIITANADQFNSEVDAANQKLQELGKSSGQAGQQASKSLGQMADGFNAAGKLMAAGGAAMLAPMVDAVRGAASLQQAMDQVGVAFNATDEQAAALEDTILDVASSTIFGAQDVAEAAKIMGKAGVSVEDATGGMIQATADFAAATDTNLPIAADIMTRTAAQWGISGKDMMGVADDLTTIFNETSLGAEDWLGGMANFAPIMRLAGASLEETGAAMGFFKDQGLSAREAGTSLTRAMDAMISPTDKQAEAMANLGITTEDFFELGDDGQRKFIGWADTFDMLNDKMSGLDDIQKAAALSAIFGKEAFDAMGLGMLADTDKLRALNAAMEDNTGIARKQSDALTDNLLGSLEELGGSYDKLRMKMGDPFLDPLQQGVEGVTDLVNALADADPAVQGFASKFIGLTGGLLTFGGLAAYGTGKVLDLGQAFKTAGLSLPKFAGGLGLVGLAIGAGLLAYETNFMGFGDAVDDAMERAGEAVETFGRVFDEAFFENRNAEMGQLAAGIAAFGTAWDAATGMDISRWTRKAAEGIDVLTDSFEAGAKAGVDPWVNALESGAKAARAMGFEDTAQELHKLSGAWDAMQRSMTETEGKMPQLNRELSALQAGLDELFGDWYEDNFGVRIPEAFDNIGSEFARMQDDITTSWNNLRPEIERTATDVKGFLDNVGTGFSNIGSEAARTKDDVTGWFEDVGQAVQDVDLGRALQGVTDDVTDWFQDTSDLLMGREALGPGDKGASEGLVSQLASNLVGGFSGLGDEVTSQLQGVGNPFAGVGEWLQQGMDEISRFFVPQEMPAGLGAGFGDTSGISQWFDGILQGFADAMPTAEDVQAVLAEKGGGFMQAIGDNILGPLGQFLFPSQDALAGGEGAALGDPAKIGEQFGAALLNTFTDPAFADSLQSSIESMPDEAFQATGSALLGAINKGMGAALTQPMPTDGGEAAGQTMGQNMAQTLATGLAEGFLSVPPETFIPAATGMMGQLNNALGVAMADAQTQFVDPSREGGLPLKGGGLGAQMAQQLATGLTAGIADAPVETFLPATTALGTKLGEAMTAIQDGTAAPTGLSESTQMTTGFGSQMVQGMATGLASGITNADPALFVPVTNALGSQLGAAMSLAAQQTQPPGGVGPAGPAVPAMGTDMVTGLAQGLTDSITNTPPETFYPVANALGNQLGTALETAMTQTVGVGQNQSGGMVGADAAGGIGKQMVADLATGLSDSITNAPAETFQPVGDALGAKMGEALQTVAAGEGGIDVSEQVGTSVSEMLTSGIRDADFAGVGEQLTTQLSDQMGQAIEDVSSEISDSMSQITEAISEAVSQMGEAIGEATEQVSQAVEDMSGAIEDAVGSVSEAVSEMGAAVEEAAAQMEEAASSAVDAASEVGDAASEAAEAVSQAMQEMAASVQEAAGAIEAAAGQIVAALNSIAAAAGAAGSAIGAALSGGFSSELGIQSPSKVFMEHGRMIAAGLSIGMQQGQTVTKGARALATMSMNAVKTAIGMGSPAKKFFPHGAAIADGMFKGMLDQAKGRIQGAMGQMAGAVESGMGKVKSAVSSAMARVKGEAAQGGAAAGEAAAAATGEGISREERQAERAARRLWRRAYRELMDGVGAARFLGESWAREFWEGMLDSSGSLAFAQYVTQQIAGAAENAVAAALGRISGLATQLEIVADIISDIQSEIASLESEQAALSGQTAQARLSDLQRELSLQRAITQELEARLKTEVSAAHQAHIRAVQTRSVAAQADYEAKLRRAVATDGARAESAIREGELAAMLDAMQQAVQQQAANELAARQATVAAELAAKRQQLAQEEALQQSLQQQQMAAQRDYTQAVINGSNERLRQLQRELRRADGADRKQTIKAEMALEQQRIATAQQLAAALDQQAQAANPEALAQANAQVQFLTQQIEALGQVDVGSLLSGIASDLGEAASALGTAAGDLGTAADALGSADASAGMSATAAATGTLGQQIAAATGGMGDMATKYREVMDQMNAEGYAFQEQFAAMTDKVRGDAATGGQDIGLALGEGIVGKITEGGPALQQTMLQQLQGATDAAETEADAGGTDIANTFGAAMRGQLGVELPQVHQDILTGMSDAVAETSKEASQGGKQIMTDFGTAALGKLEQDSGRITNQLQKPFDDGVSDAKRIATQGGKDIAGVLTDGLKLGIDAKGGIISNATAKIVRDAVQAARDEAKAKSPSRLMLALGHDMGDGLIWGLGDREADAEDASRRLVHIPMSPTSSGGVSGRRAMRERKGGGDTYIENLNLPGVSDPYQFIEIIQQIASSDGVASGR